MIVATMDRHATEPRKTHPVLAAALVLSIGIYVGCFGVVLLAAMGSRTVDEVPRTARDDERRPKLPEIGPPRPAMHNGSAFAMWGMTE